MVDKAREVQLLKGLSVGREEVEICHLQFVDDTLLRENHSINNLL